MVPHSLISALGFLALAVLANAGNSTFYLGIDPCPESCNIAGNNPNNWTIYGSQDRFNLCSQTLLVDFTLYAPISASLATTFRSCTSDFRRAATIDISSLTAEADLQLAWSNLADDQGNATQVISAARQTQGFLGSDAGSNATHVFAHSGNAVVGTYIGSDFQKINMVAATIDTFIEQYSKNNRSETLLLQLCGSGRNGNQVFGIVAGTGSSAFATVQAAVRSWKDATCVSLDLTSTLSNATIYEKIHPPLMKSNGTTPTSNSTHISKRSVLPRGTCTTTQVISGDSCTSLTQRCGITAAQLSSYNPSSTLCSSLAVGEYICCSSGTLPDLTPKQNSDGSCSSYVVQSGSYCAEIAANNMITIADIETYNTNTWGWTNCTNIQAGINICLSPGTPPMPASISNALCGPQVPNTKPPTGSITLQSLAALNPCPLNVCCDIWGQCGTTPLFCTETGQNRCISNCGQDIIVGSAPASYRSVAFFEGFTETRSCLVADIDGLNMQDYTDVILAFAGLTPGTFEVDISTIKDQFNKFTSLTYPPSSRILSIGGWAFSTDAATYNIFREAVQPANQATTAQNIAAFLDAHNLDGINLDWEYPGATDIPGVPAGDPLTEGTNYVGLLYYLRAYISPGKTISVALPASYWYLKNFDVTDMTVLVDYFVYMTYDLHGQWDYGNQWSDPGCPGGNCLRSHVNLTETMNSLVMITKAGVPTNKITIGVSSYGRSFQMVTPGCTGETCLYTGPSSGATPGPCTGTAGYISDAEIAGIIANDSSAKTFMDDGSYSNIMTYGGNQWVAYMDDTNKATRKAIFQGYNFAGSTDWAVDLQTFQDTSFNPYQPNRKVVSNNYTNAWQGINCNNNEAAVNQTMDPGDRWAAVQADAAWQDALTAWSNYKGLDSFITVISSFFVGPQSLGCGGIGADSCAGGWGCSDTQSAAGFFILNSLAWVDHMNNNLYTACGDAQGYMSTQMGEFSTQFAPIWDETEGLKIFIDMLGIGFALVASPMWNKVLANEGATFIQKGNLGWIKDSVNPVVSNGLTLTKDVSLGTPPSNQNALSADMGNTIQAWQSVIKGNNAWLFSGAPDAITALTNLISGGHLLLSPAVPQSQIVNETMQGIVETAVYANLIPEAWSFSNGDLYPFILDSGFPCTAVNPLPTYMTNADGDATYYCNPGNQQLYYLMVIEGNQAQVCTQTPCSGQAKCTPNKFSVPPGITHLDGKAYGGIVKDDFIIGALAGYNNNKQQNGWPSATAGANTTTAAATLNQYGILSPGVVSIPVCAADIAWTNWLLQSTGGANYPCQPVTPITKREAMRKRDELLRNEDIIKREAVAC